jgi:hypothetical protein
MATTNDRSVGRNRVVSSVLRFSARLGAITDFRCVLLWL